MLGGAGPWQYEVGEAPAPTDAPLLLAATNVLLDEHAPWPDHVAACVPALGGQQEGVPLAGAQRAVSDRHVQVPPSTPRPRPPLAAFPSRRRTRLSSARRTRSARVRSAGARHRRRFFKKFRVAELDSAAIPLDAKQLTFAHANNTLIVSVRRTRRVPPPTVAVRQAARIRAVRGAAQGDAGGGAAGTGPEGECKPS